MRLRKNTAWNFFSLLAQGQRHDWQYSLVMMLVISGLVCTPLILGSIRNRAYEVHKTEVEINNNAREIRVRSAGERSKAQLDDALVTRLHNVLPGVRAIGTYTLTLRPQGPKGSFLVSAAKALGPDDPRVDVFQIEHHNGKPLAFREVVVSDAVGERIYGKKAWHDAWSGTQFTGGPLKIVNGDDELEGTFDIVGRQRRFGAAMYFSQEFGAELRRAADGLGAPKFGILPNPDLVELSLPKLRTASCAIVLPRSAVCPPDRHENLQRDLRDRQHQIDEKSSLNAYLPEKLFASFSMRPVELIEEKGSLLAKPIVANCRNLIGPTVANRCVRGEVAADVRQEVMVRAAGSKEGGRQAHVIGVTETIFDKLRPTLDLDAPAGSVLTMHSLREKGAISVVVPQVLGAKMGDTLNLVVGQSISVPALVTGVYQCSLTDATSPAASQNQTTGRGITGELPDGAPFPHTAIAGQADASPLTFKPAKCDIMADVESAFRLVNLHEGSAEIASRTPFLLRSRATGVMYDKILVYAASVEEVMDLSAKLRSILGSDYQVSPREIVIRRLNRDNARLSAVFMVTLTFAVVFLLFSLSALSKINIDRRNRQMAQLFIFGFSRWFVKLLVIAEYLLVTLLSTAFALAISVGLCAGLQALLLGGIFGEKPTDKSFLRVVNAIRIDADMFWLVAAVVATCALLVAAVVAQIAARADPVELLE